MVPISLAPIIQHYLANRYFNQIIHERQIETIENVQYYALIIVDI